LQKMFDSLTGDPERLSATRAEFVALAQPYYMDNMVHQDYLLTRANAR
jgi:hypothetical protein